MGTIRRPSPEKERATGGRGVFLPPCQPGAYGQQILTMVLHARLAPMINDTVGECQHGFRGTWSATDNIITLRPVCEEYSHLHDRQLIVDLTQALDQVIWRLRWHSLRISGAVKPLVSVLQTIYKDIEKRVRTGTLQERPRVVPPHRRCAPRMCSLPDPVHPVV